MSDLTHTGLPPERLSQFQLNLTHKHEYSVIATPVSILAHHNNLTWRDPIPKAQSCQTETLYIDLTPPPMGFLSVLQYSHEREYVPYVTRRYQHRKDVAFIFAPGWDDPESGISTIEVTILHVQTGAILQGPKVLPPMTYIPFALGLKHLESYYYEWRATNFAGMATFGRSLSVTIDITRPIITYVGDFGRVDDERDYVRDAKPLQVVWDAFDPDSGIDSVKWCVGTMRGSCDAGKPITIHPSIRTATRSDLDKTISTGVRYFSTVFVRNGAGIIIPKTTDGFKLDLEPPVCAFVLDGPGIDYNWVGQTRLKVRRGFGTDSGVMPISWHVFDTVSGVHVLEMALVATRVGGGFDDPHTIDPTNVTALVGEVGEWKRVDKAATSTSIASSILEHGTFYVAVLRATDRVDRTTICTSSGFGVDFTPPLMGYVVSQFGNPQTITHMIWLKVYDLADPESGIYRIFASVGYAADSFPDGVLAGRKDQTAYSGGEVAFLGTSDELVLTGLDLPQGDVVVYVRAVNYAGEVNTTEIPMLIDNIPPECSGVSLWGRPVGEPVFEKYLPDIVATWTCNDYNGSGIMTAEWAVGQEPGSDDALPWMPSDWTVNASYALPWRFVQTPQEVHERNHSLLSGVRYFVSVRTVDFAGNVATQISAPFMLDNTPPFVTSPVILVHNASHPRWPNRIARSWPRDDVLIARFKLDDLESGIRAIRIGVAYTYGELLGGWDDPALTVELPPTARTAVMPVPAMADGTIAYMHACAIDHVNLTACSPFFEFIVDLTPPVCNAPIDYIGGEPAGAYTSSNGALAANTLMCEDGNSILNNIEWQGYSSLNQTLLLNPIYLGNPQDVLQVGGLQRGPSTLQGAAVAIVDMQPGVRYYSCATAVDAAGHESAAACSVGTVYDNQPPVVGELIDGDGSRFLNGSEPELCTSWFGFADAQSGLSELAYTLFVMDEDFMPQPVATTLLPVAGEGRECRSVELIEGGTYYSQVVAKDVAGMRARAISGGFTVDSSGPLAGSAEISVAFPPGFDRQTGFPDNVTGLVLVVRADGFEDPESGIATYEVAVFDEAGEMLYNSSILADDTEVRTEPFGTIANGTTLLATVVAKNGAGGFSRAVQSDPVEVVLKALQPGRIWNVGRELRTLKKWSSSADFVGMVRGMDRLAT